MSLVHPSDLHPSAAFCFSCFLVQSILTPFSRIPRVSCTPRPFLAGKISLFFFFFLPLPRYPFQPPVLKRGPSTFLGIPLGLTPLQSFRYSTLPSELALLFRFPKHDCPCFVFSDPCYFLAFTLGRCWMLHFFLSRAFFLS